ncbi:hypothetical protein H5410_029966 [Solanum commersonii]|uniref:Uncharacterized protein n=1 Tax=Solanum commersonii TaxID=4109 RepID=A0A9J5YH93_SOLCO|nr:hypothetical protein H5410_029966 [Solanum commersonii]
MHLCSPTEAYALLQFKQFPTTFVVGIMITQEQSFGMRVGIAALGMESLVTCYREFEVTEISYLSNLVSLHLSGYDLQLDERTFETMLHNFTDLELLALPLVDISSPADTCKYFFFLLKPNLENLKLGDNRLLKGVLPKIHPSNTLLKLDISFTRISGELPDSIDTLSSLNLYGCQFSGHIPDSIGNLTQIRELWFWGNRFTGHIPSTISKLKHLTREIPDIFSNLQQLCYFDLSDNRFIGPLKLSRNSLSDPLPSNASMLPKLTYLDLSYNSLNGTIPSWLFSLPLLSSLSFQHYRLRGLADEVIKTNPTIKDLHLSNNQLSGSFPQSLVNLTNLSTLDISTNNSTMDEGMNITFPSLQALQLSSCELKDFPHFLTNIKTLRYLYISNNKICGQIPDWFSGMRWDNLWSLNISHNLVTEADLGFRVTGCQAEADPHDLIGVHPLTSKKCA